MNERQVIERLRAFQQGRAIPRGSTIHFKIARDEQILVLAFVRMGGESRPWGIALGCPNQEPIIFTVPEARNRGQVAEMVSLAAPLLLEHFRCPQFSAVQATEWEELRPLAQLWLPNAAHLDMLHNLAYAYTFTRHGEDLRETLNALGRLCGWLFREAQRPGQMHVMAATQALRDSYCFPAEDTRQGHLGFLLAWLQAEGGREERLVAALEAERMSISSTLDPSIERDELEPLLEHYHEAQKNADLNAEAESVAAIDTVLRSELQHRFDLTVRAIRTLRDDPRRENHGTQRLADESLKEQWFQYLRMELKRNDADDGPAFVASPETDRHSAAAGSRYQIFQASEDLLHSALIHDDEQLLEEAIAAGEAFRAEIQEVWDEGTRRTTRPVWRLLDRVAGPMKAREGSWLCPVGQPQRRVEVRQISMTRDGREIELEVTGHKTVHHPQFGKPVDEAWVGQTLAFTSYSAEGISRRKSQKIWKRDLPGAWLTHAGPHGPRARIQDEAAEDLNAIDTALREGAGP